jgi:MoxR-like ATPase
MAFKTDDESKTESPISPTALATTADSDAPEPAKLPPDALLERWPRTVRQLHDAVGQVVIGHAEAVDAVVYALLARGHCLLVGVPGVGKTLLVRTLGRLLGLPFSRIQFTPDLMPSDITGTEILEEDHATGRRRFVFAKGPIFTHLLLADEINRTPPKTQAALLEAMQEKTVSIAGKLHRLDEPFVVLATQNPIEQEGTYPLPEAQLDRFLFAMNLGYPSAEEERRVVAGHSYAPTENLEPLLGPEDILDLRDAVAKIPAPPNVVDFAVRLARSTRPEDEAAPDYVKRWIRWGASPRASQNLILAGRARAACQGRYNVAREDVRALALWVLRHRLIRTFQAEADGETTDSIIARLLGDLGD